MKSYGIEFERGTFIDNANIEFGDTLPDNNSATPGQLFFKTDENKLYIQNANNTSWLSVTPAGVSIHKGQKHGFTNDDIGTPIYFDGSKWVRAIADDILHVPTAAVSHVIDSEHFITQQSGTISNISTRVNVEGKVLDPGTYYYVSNTVPGKYTRHEPKKDQIKSLSILAITKDSALLLNYAPQKPLHMNDIADLNIPVGTTQAKDGQIIKYNAKSSPPGWEFVDFIDTQKNDYLLKTGDTMTGALVLNADPNNSKEAATKHYIDDQLSAKNTYSGQPDQNKAPRLKSDGHLGWDFLGGSPLNFKGTFNPQTNGGGSLAGIVQDGVAGWKNGDIIIANKDGFYDPKTGKAGTSTNGGFLEIDSSDWLVYEGIGSSGSFHRIESASMHEEAFIWRDGTRSAMADISMMDKGARYKIIDIKDPDDDYDAANKGYVDKELSKKFDIAGGTLTGTLTLNADPTSNLEAATKQYIDNKLAAFKPTVTSTGPTGPITIADVTKLQAKLNDKVDISGDTMTGTLTLAADPGSAMEAATQQYVDNKITSIGPTTPKNHQHDISDVNILQSSIDAKLDIAGGQTMTGLLILSGDPTNTKGAATKHYVDTTSQSVLSDKNTFSGSGDDNKAPRLKGGYLDWTFLNGSPLTFKGTFDPTQNNGGANPGTPGNPPHEVKDGVADWKNGDVIVAKTDGFYDPKAGKTGSAATSDYLEIDSSDWLVYEGTGTAGSFHRIESASVHEEIFVWRDGTRGATSNIPMGDSTTQYKITNLADPTDPTDAANKKYVIDNKITALSKLIADVNIDPATVSNGQALIYDSPTKRWIPGAAGVKTLKSLTDTTIGTTIPDGASLIYDNGTSKWVPKNITPNVADVTLTGGTSGSSTGIGTAWKKYAPKPTDPIVIASYAGSAYVRTGTGDQDTDWTSLGSSISYLRTAGGTISGNLEVTGTLTLHADPNKPLEAATKQYADEKVNKAGDTMTGALTLPHPDPTEWQATHKHYVDTTVNGILSAKNIWSTTADVNKAPKLNTQGKVDWSFLGGSPLGFKGTFDPTADNGGTKAPHHVIDTDTNWKNGDVIVASTNGAYDTVHGKGQNHTKGATVPTGFIEIDSSDWLVYEKQGTAAGAFHRIESSSIHEDLFIWRDGSRGAMDDIPMGGNTLTDLKTPTTSSANTDAATKGYVDTEVAKKADKTHQHEITEVKTLQTTLDGKVAKAGSTMTGTLTLNADPVHDNEASTKKYVDKRVATAAGKTHTHTIANVDTLQTTLDGKLDLAGDTMTGKLILDADPVKALEAATKQYVDNKVKNTTPKTHTHTIANVTNLQDRLDDKVNKAGDTMGGPLTLPRGTPGTYDAAHKNYVDTTVNGILSAKNIWSTTADHDKAPKLNTQGKVDWSFLGGSPLGFKGTFNPKTNGGASSTGRVVKDGVAGWENGNVIIANKDGFYDPTTGKIGTEEKGTVLAIDSSDWLVYEGTGATGKFHRIESASMHEEAFIWRDGSRAAQQNIPMDGHKLTGLGNPSANQDAATKKYVDDEDKKRAPKTHQHTIAQVTNLQRDLNKKLNLTGGTLSGVLTLHADPTGDSEAATKHYVDNTFATTTPKAHTHTQAQVSGLSTALAGKLPLAGGTMTGTLTLHADPTTNLHAATKKYVDNRVKTASPKTHTHTIGQVTNLQSDLDDKLDIAGGQTMTGLLILSGDPTNTKGAATKHYVDLVPGKVLSRGNTAWGSGDVNKAPKLDSDGKVDWSFLGGSPLGFRGTFDPTALNGGSKALHPVKDGYIDPKTSKPAWNNGDVIVANKDGAYDPVHGKGKTHTKGATVPAGFIEIDSSDWLVYEIDNTKPTDKGSFHRVESSSIHEDLFIWRDGSRGAQHDIPMGNHKLTGLRNPTGTADATNKGYVDAKFGSAAPKSHSHPMNQVTGLSTALAGKLALAGGTMTGELLLDAAPTKDNEAATKKYVDDEIKGIGPSTPRSHTHAMAQITGLSAEFSKKLNLTGGTMTGPIHLIRTNPTGTYDAAHKHYVDIKVAGVLSHQDSWYATTDHNKAPKLNSHGNLDWSFLGGSPLSFKGTFDPTVKDGGTKAPHPVKDTDTNWKNGDIVVANKNGFYNPATGVSRTTKASGYIEIDSSDWLVYEKQGSAAGSFHRIESANIHEEAFIWRDGTRAAQHDIPMGNHKLTGLRDPSATTDAATKHYVDTHAVHYASDAEVKAGTITTKAINPKGLNSRLVYTGDPIPTVNFEIVNSTFTSTKYSFSVNSDGSTPSHDYTARILFTANLSASSSTFATLASISIKKGDNVSAVAKKIVDACKTLSSSVIKSVTINPKSTFTFDITVQNANYRINDLYFKYMAPNAGQSSDVVGKIPLLGTDGKIDETLLPYKCDVQVIDLTTQKTIPRIDFAKHKNIEIVTNNTLNFEDRWIKTFPWEGQSGIITIVYTGSNCKLLFSGKIFAVPHGNAKFNSMLKTIRKIGAVDVLSYYASPYLIKQNKILISAVTPFLPNFG